MKILNTPVRDLTFEDVVEFCKEKQVEGIQIDYKKDFPQKGLAKHFAAFSNTRGGIIIVGVEEDTKTGLPIKWEGITNEGKLEDRVHQFASNVEPLPDYDVHTTNEVDGKVFLLIRIFEGVKTPYYPQNDSNIWVRTGNISNSIDIASPEWTELLIGKEEKAKLARENYIHMAEAIYANGLIREDKKRKTLIVNAKQKGDGSESKYYQKNLGVESAMCRVIIQPYFPRNSLASPKQIKDKISEFSYSKGFSTFPELNMESMPNGIFNFSHNYDGFIECQQVYAQGLMYHNLDVLRVDRETGKRIIYISYIAGTLFELLASAKLFYNLFGYQGVIVGFLSLEKTVEVEFEEISANGYFPRHGAINLLPEYKWELNLDTEILNNEDEFINFILSTLRDIYWGLGYADMNDNLITNFFKQSRFIS